MAFSAAERDVVILTERAEDFARLGGFADLARRIARGDQGDAPGTAIEQVVTLADAQRARDDSDFAAALIRWNELGRPTDRVFPIEAALAALMRCAEVPLTWRRLFALAVYTCTRAGELAVLEWRDVDLAHGVVLVHRAGDDDTSESNTAEGQVDPSLRARREAPTPEAGNAQKPTDTGFRDGARSASGGVWGALRATWDTAAGGVRRVAPAYAAGGGGGRRARRGAGRTDSAAVAGVGVIGAVRCAVVLLASTARETLNSALAWSASPSNGHQRPLHLPKISSFADGLWPAVVVVPFAVVGIVLAELHEAAFAQ